jgi:hypothetical protein
MDLASKHPLGGPNRYAMRGVADALTDTSSKAFTPHQLKLRFRGTISDER